MGNSFISNKDEANLFTLLPIKNAGLVLIQGYIQTLFSRLDLLSDDKFKSDEAQRKAVHFLQYIATAQKITDENYLILNKLLCGIPIEKPVGSTINFAESDIITMEGLLEAMINHWPQNGSSSTDGFRGNWLIREGALSEKEDRWDLVVEKKPYDILLARSPFSFLIIKFRWMNKPIYITWNY